MFLVRVIVCIAVFIVGAAVIGVGVAVARDYRNVASKRYDSWLAFNPFGNRLGRRTDKVDFETYKRYASLPFFGFGIVVLAIGINGLVHL
jgi:hypothetical protein